LRFLGERLWLSPHGRARHRAQLARAKPEEPPPGGGDAAPIRVLCDGGPGSCLLTHNLNIVVKA